MNPVKSRPRRLGGLIAAVAAVLALGIGAAPASATPNLSPVGPYAEEETILVSGTAPAAATHVAVAVCNVEFAVGTRCDVDSATKTLKTKAQYAAGISTDIQKGPWQNWNLTGGMPTPLESSTTCKDVYGEGERCAVFISFYEVIEEEGEIVEINRLEEEDSAEILFE